MGFARACNCVSQGEKLGGGLVYFTHPLAGHKCVLKSTILTERVGQSNSNTKFLRNYLQPNYLFFQVSIVQVLSLIGTGATVPAML